MPQIYKFCLGLACRIDCPQSLIYPIWNSDHVMHRPSPAKHMTYYLKEPLRDFLQPNMYCCDNCTRIKAFCFVNTMPADILVKYVIASLDNGYDSRAVWIYIPLLMGSHTRYCTNTLSVYEYMLVGSDLFLKQKLWNPQKVLFIMCLFYTLMAGPFGQICSYG